jgi:hypothetical protein
VILKYGIAKIRRNDMLNRMNRIGMKRRLGVGTLHAYVKRRGFIAADIVYARNVNPWNDFSMIDLKTCDEFHYILSLSLNVSMFDKKDLVAYAAARRFKRNPRTLLGDFGTLVIAVKFARYHFDYARRSAVNLNFISLSYRMILNFNLGYSRLGEIIDNDADMALYRRG